MWAIGAIQFSRRTVHSERNILYVFAIGVTALMIGLRFQVGGDWYNYLTIYENIYFQPLTTALTLSDPGYALFNWIAAQIGFGVWFPNTICGIIFMIGLGRLALRQPNPWLAILIAVPYLIIVVAMGYTRQAAAIGLICYGLADASETKLIRIIVIIGIAALFHKTAILILPIILIPVFRRNILFGVAGGLAFVLLFYLILSRSSNEMITNYAQSGYNSQGAGIRVAMNVGPAIIMLLYYKRMQFSNFINSYWISNSILALASVPSLFVLSGSSAVDRISLFIIPLQMVVYGKLPYAFSKTSSANVSVMISMVGYCFLVQFVWLNYAVNAQLWIPYTINVQ
jgi:hypothetical protein